MKLSNMDGGDNMGPAFTKQRWTELPCHKRHTKKKKMVYHLAQTTTSIILHILYRESADGFAGRNIMATVKTFDERHITSKYYVSA